MSKETIDDVLIRAFRCLEPHRHKVRRAEGDGGEVGIVSLRYERRFHDTHAALDGGGGRLQL
jgi:hypothetical protein